MQNVPFIAYAPPGEYGREVVLTERAKKIGLAALPRAEILELSKALGDMLGMQIDPLVSFLE